MRIDDDGVTWITRSEEEHLLRLVRDEHARARNEFKLVDAVARIAQLTSRTTADVVRIAEDNGLW